MKGSWRAPTWRGRLTCLGVQGNILRCWFPDSNRGRKREHGHDKFEHSNLSPSVAAPATVSGELSVHYGHWVTGKAGPPRQRPASQETCQRSHPTGGRGVHTERSFAAVTAMPVRRPCEQLLPRHSAGETRDVATSLAILCIGFGLHRCVRNLRERKRRNVVSWGRGLSSNL